MRARDFHAGASVGRCGEGLSRLVQRARDALSIGRETVERDDIHRCFEVEGHIIPLAAIELADCDDFTCERLTQIGAAEGLAELIGFGRTITAGRMKRVPVAKPQLTSEQLQGFGMGDEIALLFQSASQLTGLLFQIGQVGENR